MDTGARSSQTEGDGRRRKNRVAKKGEGRIVGTPVPEGAGKNLSSNTILMQTIEEFDFRGEETRFLGFSQLTFKKKKKDAILKNWKNMDQKGEPEE